jgi:hypothetical protein
MKSACGFSLLEMLIALTLTLGVVGGVFAVLNPARGSLSAEPERGDVQQRLRVGQDALYRDLAAAGAGIDVAGDHSRSGPLVYWFAPVLPGILGVSAAGTYASDAVTVVRVAAATGQSLVAADVHPGDSTVTLEAEPNCAPGEVVCRFSSGSSLLLFDDSGQWDMFSIASVNRARGTLGLDRAAGSSYRAGTHAAAAAIRSFHLKTNPADGSSQLMQYDPSTGSDAALIDHVVGLSFTYAGDPQAPVLTRPLADRDGPWTTYGPAPPPVGVSNGTSYPAGENCAFLLAGGATSPRLDLLADPANPSALVPIGPDQLVDGPWCPDDSRANRWDADLLRIRKIFVALRVESALDALRGPAGVLFRRAGTSRNASRWVPDADVRFQVTPRNLNLER